MPDIELSVVIPAFNEEHRLPRTLERLLSAVDLATTEIIVVDDGSSDATTPLALELTSAHRHTRVISLPENQGKGAAVRTGIASAEGQQMLFMDADLATDLSCIADVSAALEGADVAIGSRVAPGARVDGFGTVRTIISRGFNRLIRMTSSLDLGDTQCGFKGFRGDAAKLLFHLGRIDRFAFDIEILQAAGRLGMNVTEVPVRWKAVDGSTVRPIADSLATALDLRRATAVHFDGSVPALQLSHTDQLAGLPVWATVCAQDDGHLALLPLCNKGRIALIADACRTAAPGASIEQRTTAARDLPELLRQRVDSPA
jgi:hypothetical protein